MPARIFVCAFDLRLENEVSVPAHDGYRIYGADRAPRAIHASYPVDRHGHGLPGDLPFHDKPFAIFRIVDMGYGDPSDILQSLVATQIMNLSIPFTISAKTLDPSCMAAVIISITDAPHIRGDMPSARRKTL